MKIKLITIHNFRSIIEETFELSYYSLLIGSNNCGKSNIIDAIRIFYEKDNYKFEYERDFPKKACNPKDGDVWIEIKYRCTDDEFLNLKEEYKKTDNCFRVRKNIYIEKTDKKGKKKLGIFGYERWELSNNAFYGWKNVASGKLGEIIFIPAVSDLDSNVKMSGPSPFRDLIIGIAKKVVAKSNAFTELDSAFTKFNDEIKKEKSEGDSFTTLEKDLTLEIQEWGVRFKIDFNKLNPDDLMKNLVSHKLIDEKLNDELKSSSFGQGLQRHLIFSLIKILAEYSQSSKTSSQTESKKEFSPELTLLLYEEPEAFLHPPQKSILHSKLKSYATEESQQVLISTHSPYFVNKSILNLPNLIKVNKYDCVSEVKQILAPTILFNNNDAFNAVVAGSCYENRDGLSPEVSESIKYFLWLNAERFACFFAKNVLLVEGATEKCFLDYLIENAIIKIKVDQLYILDCMGKFNIHRFMGLFNELGIYHYILYDEDTGHAHEAVHNRINQFIKNSSNTFTKKIDSIDPNLERFLGTPLPDKDHKKPLFVLYHYMENQSHYEPKVKTIESKLNTLFS